MTLYDRIQKGYNKLPFTIPINIYNDNEYTIERRLIILLIANILEINNLFKILNKKQQDKIIINIEKSCYNETLKKAEELLIYKSWENEKFCYLYQLYCNKITKNLDISSEVKSDYLFNQIINDLIDINNIASLSSDQLCPDKSENIKKNIRLRSDQEIKTKTSSLYTCPNCHKKETKLKMVQLRSLDEGYNISLTCVFCNFNWIR